LAHSRRRQRSRLKISFRLLPSSIHTTYAAHQGSPSLRSCGFDDTKWCIHPLHGSHNILPRGWFPFLSWIRTLFPFKLCRFPWLRNPSHGCLTFNTSHIARTRSTVILRPYRLPFSFPFLSYMIIPFSCPGTQFAFKSLPLNVLLLYYCSSLRYYSFTSHTHCRLLGLTSALVVLFSSPSDLAGGEQDGRGRCVCGGSGYRRLLDLYLPTSHCRRVHSVVVIHCLLRTII